MPKPPPPNSIATPAPDTATPQLTSGQAPHPAPAQVTLPPASGLAPHTAPIDRIPEPTSGPAPHAAPSLPASGPAPHAAPSHVTPEPTSGVVSVAAPAQLARELISDPAPHVALPELDLDSALGPAEHAAPPERMLEPILSLAPHASSSRPIPGPASSAVHAPARAAPIHPEPPSSTTPPSPTNPGAVEPALNTAPPQPTSALDTEFPTSAALIAWLDSLGVPWRTFLGQEANPEPLPYHHPPASLQAFAGPEAPADSPPSAHHARAEPQAELSATSPCPDAFAPVLDPAPAPAANPGPDLAVDVAADLAANAPIDTFAAASASDPTAHTASGLVAHLAPGSATDPTAHTASDLVAHTAIGTATGPAALIAADSRPTASALSIHTSIHSTADAAAPDSAADPAEAAAVPRFPAPLLPTARLHFRPRPDIPVTHHRPFHVQPGMRSPEARAAEAEMIRKAAEALRQAGPEAVLTSHTAVRLYGCTAAEMSPIHVLLRPGRRIRGRVGLTIHRGRWERHQTEAVHDLRTLSLDHALAVMLGHAEFATALLCLHQALARHPPGFRDLVRAAVKVLPDSASRRRAEVLLVS